MMEYVVDTSIVVWWYVSLMWNNPYIYEFFRALSNIWGVQNNIKGIIITISQMFTLASEEQHPKQW